MDPHDADRHAIFRNLAASQNLSEDTINKLIKECLDIQTISKLTNTETTRKDLGLSYGQGVNLMHWAEQLRKHHSSTRDTSTETIEDDADKDETDSSGSSHTHSTQPQTDPVIEPDTNGQTCAFSDMYEGTTVNDCVDKSQATEAIKVSEGCLTSHDKDILPASSTQAHKILPEHPATGKNLGRPDVEPNNRPSEQGKETTPPKHRQDRSMEPSRRPSEQAKETTPPKHQQDSSMEPSRRPSEQAKETTPPKHQQDSSMEPSRRQLEQANETTPPKHQQDRSMAPSRRQLEQANETRPKHQQDRSMEPSRRQLEQANETTPKYQQDRSSRRNSEEQRTQIMESNRRQYEQGNKQTRHSL